VDGDNENFVSTVSEPPVEAVPAVPRSDSEKTIAPENPSNLIEKSATVNQDPTETNTDSITISETNVDYVANRLEDAAQAIDSLVSPVEEEVDNEENKEKTEDSPAKTTEEAVSTEDSDSLKQSKNNLEQKPSEEENSKEKKEEEIPVSDIMADTSENGIPKFSPTQKASHVPDLMKVINLDYKDMELSRKNEIRTHVTEFAAYYTPISVFKEAEHIHNEPALVSLLFEKIEDENHPAIEKLFSLLLITSRFCNYDFLIFINVLSSKV